MGEGADFYEVSAGCNRPRHPPLVLEGDAFERDPFDGFETQPLTSDLPEIQESAPVRPEAHRHAATSRCLGVKSGG